MLQGSFFRASNPEVNSFMEEKNITGDYAALEAYFVKRVLDIVKGFNRTSVIWEDLIENGVEIYEDTIVQVWKENYIGMLEKVRLHSPLDSRRGCFRWRCLPCVPSYA